MVVSFELWLKLKCWNIVEITAKIDWSCDQNWNIQKTHIKMLQFVLGTFTLLVRHQACNKCHSAFSRCLFPENFVGLAVITSKSGEYVRWVCVSCDHFTLVYVVMCCSWMAHAVSMSGVHRDRSYSRSHSRSRSRSHSHHRRSHSPRKWTDTRM